MQMQVSKTNRIVVIIGWSCMLCLLLSLFVVGCCGFLNVSGVRVSAAFPAAVAMCGIGMALLGWVLLPWIVA